jgi:hypothetical protein
MVNQERFWHVECRFIPAIRFVGKTSKWCGFFVIFQFLPDVDVIQIWWFCGQSVQLMFLLSVVLHYLADT